MGALSPKLRSVGDGSGNLLGFMHWCPACDQAHAVWTERVPSRNGPVWQWDRDVNRPTTSPSIKITCRRPAGFTNENPAPAGYSGPYVTDVCHYFLRAGNIDFCPDCTHALAGKSVPLPDFDQEWGVND